MLRFEASGCSVSVFPFTVTPFPPDSSCLARLSDMSAESMARAYGASIGVVGVFTLFCLGGAQAQRWPLGVWQVLAVKRLENSRTYVINRPAHVYPCAKQWVGSNAG